MSKSYTISQIAKATNRNNSSICRLIKTGKLTATKNGRVSLVAFDNREAMITQVQQLLPRGGWHKAKKVRGDSALAPLLEWARLDTDKRALLLKVADKFTAEELEIILEL